LPPGFLIVHNPIIIRVLNRVVFRLIKKNNIGVASIGGGDIRKNIPTDVYITVACLPKGLERLKVFVKSRKLEILFCL